MKNINYSLGGGYVYQWWIGAFIKYTIDNFNNEDTYYTKTYSKELKELIKSNFVDYEFSNSKNIDILLEGNGDYFEDINLLFKEEGNKTNILFFQIKGGNEIKLKDGEIDIKKVLTGDKNVRHLFSNFLKNKNIYEISNNSKFIILSNKYLNKNIVSISKGEDSSLIINQVISEIRKKFKGKIKTSGKGIKKLEILIKKINNGNHIKKRYYGTTLPFNNIEDQEKIILFIKNTLAIIYRTEILENFKLDIIYEKLFIELGEEKVNKLFQDIMNNSINISTIKRRDSKFNKYLKYDDIFFADNNKISNIDEIREGKIL